MITNWTKLGLHPENSSFWHAIENGVSADYSGNSRHITASSNGPDVVAQYIGNKSAFYFDGTKNPLVNNTPILIKHIFIVAKYSNPTFAGSNGLLSDTGDIPVLIGHASGATKFFNNTQSITYRKNNVSYAESAMSAPMAEWALLEIQSPAGLPMIGWQIGRDRSDNTRRWIGGFAEDSAFGSILSTDDRRRAILYYNLKYGAYFGTPIALEFPDPVLTGLHYARFVEIPPDWDEITVSHKYQDASKSFNETAAAPPRKWEVGFTGLSYDEMRIFDEFAARVRRSVTFDFTDKYGEKHTGVRVDSYERNHNEHIEWINEVKFKLIKY